MDGWMDRWMDGWVMMDGWVDGDYEFLMDLLQRLNLVMEDVRRKKINVGRGG